MNNTLKVIVAATLLSVSSAALAAVASLPASGGISFSASDALPGDWDFNLKALDFEDGLNAKVDEVKFDFASLFDENDLVEFFDLNYGSFNSTQLLWSGETINGNILQYFIETLEVVVDTPEILALKGSGYFAYENEMMKVDGNWIITGQDLSSFSWSASTSVVPEPGTLALLGLGMVGLGAARRRQKA
jgi:hypothetical protein